MAARVVSVNVGVPTPHQWRGRTVTTAIVKHPVEGRVPVRGVNLVGDDQADRRVHGGVDKAVYAYSVEDLVWWEAALGRSLPHGGVFGENLTTEGIDLTASCVGDRWAVGSVVLEVAQPRMPCYKLGMVLGDDDLVEVFSAAGRPGAYLRIVEEGEVEAGDAIVVTRADPADGPLLALGPISLLDGDEPWLQSLAADERVPNVWRRGALQALAHR